MVEASVRGLRVMQISKPEECEGVDLQTRLR